MSRWGSTGNGEEWSEVSRASLVGWLAFYVLFFVHALRNQDGFLILDFVNLPIHEAGHFFFSWFGDTLMILGGTLGELMVPLFLAVYFLRRRETTGTAFTSFWFFENFLYIGTYMADARTAALPLVGSGDHDWEILFTKWNVIVQDRQIGGATRCLGWLGMLATVVWLVWKAERTPQRSVSRPR